MLQVSSRNCHFTGNIHVSCDSAINTPHRLYKQKTHILQNYMTMLALLNYISLRFVSLRVTVASRSFLPLVCRDNDKIDERNHKSVLLRDTRKRKLEPVNGANENFLKSERDLMIS
jgi:hypothetical protein